MQRQRPAGEQPRHQRQRDAGERAERDRRQDRRVLRKAAFQKRGEPARDQLALAARDRHQAVARDIERHDGDMGGGMARPHGWLEEFGRCRTPSLVERHDAVRQIVAEAADVRIGNSSAATCMAMSACACAPMRDEVMIALAPTRRKRGHHLLHAPEQRQRRRDHAGAQHAEQRDDAVHGVGELNRHHGVGLQPERAQPGGKRRYGAVGLRHKSAGAAAGRSGFRNWADRPAPARRRGVRRRGGTGRRAWRGYRRSCCVPLRIIWRPRATTFPADSRTTRSERDARFASSALSIVWAGSRAVPRRSRTTARGRARGWRRRNPAASWR